MTAPKKNNQAKSTKSAPTRTNRDSMRWIFGLLLLFTGLYLTASVLFYYFTWRADMSLVSGTAPEDPRLADLAAAVENPCGYWGAWMAERFVGRSFGFFGIILPVILVMLGIRIIRQRPLLINHSVLSALMILILGSLTFGFFFDEKWAVFGSGWGGAFGIEVSRMLTGAIGTVGNLLLLLGAWILTGVFINRNFINTVNTAGNVMVNKGEKIVDLVKHSVAHATERGEQEEDAGPEPQRTPAVEKTPVALESPVADVKEPVSPEPKPEPEPEPAQVAIERPKEPLAEIEEESPFLEIVPGEAPSAKEESSAAQKATSGQGTMTSVRLAGPPVADGDDVFTEFDLSAAPSEPEKKAERPVDEETPEDGVEMVTTEDGFIEYTLVKHPEPTPEPKLAPTPEPRPMPVLEPRMAQTVPEGVVVTVEEHQARVVDEKSIENNLYDPLKDLNNYQRPPVSLLEDYTSDSQVSDEEIYENKSKIEQTLKDFGIPIQRIKATVGPTVTLYEIVQAQGVKISKIQGLENDIAQSLKALGIRIIAPIPGKGTIGIEVPNRDKQIVSMYSAIRSLRFQESKAELPVVIGRTIQNENYVFDLAKMPHLLVAGATGQGKSVGLNAIITSLLYKKHPSQLKFVMIDPKMVEFSLYAKIEKHFLAKMESEEEAIITDPRKAVYTLNALCTEMDNRLELCKKAGARNIAEYNEKFVNRQLNPEKGHRYLPYIVVVVDEFADLIMTAREVEGPVMRLAQKARAIGIHLIIATQRPDVKVITGGIKANFPARIAFRVMQMIDSRTIIDQPGANQLIGRGDMLFSKDGELFRIQCALVETKEVERIVDFIAKQQGYTEAYRLPDYVPDSGGDSPSLGSESGAPMKYDSLFAEVARAAVSQGQISTSSIQRNYEVGFNRAGRIMMQLERAGIVGRQEGAKPRDILYHDLPSLEARLQDLGVF